MGASVAGTRLAPRCRHRRRWFRACRSAPRAERVGGSEVSQLDLDASVERDAGRRARSRCSRATVVHATGQCAPCASHRTRRIALVSGKRGSGWIPVLGKWAVQRRRHLGFIKHFRVFIVDRSALDCDKRVLGVIRFATWVAYDPNSGSGPMVAGFKEQPEFLAYGTRAYNAVLKDDISRHTEDRKRGR